MRFIESIIKKNCIWLYYVIWFQVLSFYYFRYYMLTVNIKLRLCMTKNKWYLIHLFKLIEYIDTIHIQ